MAKTMIDFGRLARAEATADMQRLRAVLRVAQPDVEELAASVPSRDVRWIQRRVG